MQTSTQQSWPEPVQRVSAVLRAAAVDARIEEFEGGTPSAREAARAAGCELAQIVKSLVLVCDGAYVLALVPGDARADEGLIARRLEVSEVRIARPHEVLHATGFEPGGVAPFPQRAVTRTLMDRSFFRFDIVWVGAGSSFHMAAIGPSELQRLTGGTTVDLTSRG